MVKRLVGLFGLVCLTGSSLTSPILAQTPSQTKVNVSPPVLPVGADGDMKAVVSISAVSQPLSIVLKTLSAASGVAVQAAPSIRDQRVTLCVKNKPLSHVAACLASLLSHDVGGEPHYFWQDDNQSGEKVYTLRPTASAAVKYRENLSKPRQEAIQTLKDFRALAQLPKAERGGYKTRLSALLVSHVDDGPYTQAIKELTEPQFTRFLKTGYATLQAAKIQESLTTYNAMAKKDRFVASGLAKVPDGPYRPPVTQIQLRFFSCGQYGSQTTGEIGLNDPVLSEFYGFQLGGISAAYTYLNVFPNEPNRAGRLLEDHKPGETPPLYDLNGLLGSASATFSQRNDFGFILSALSRASGASIYEEHFLRPGYWGDGQLGSGKPDILDPTVTKGTLPQLLNSLCDKYDYDASQTKNGDYVFWSRRWGRDKQADISETVLAPWRRNLKSKGYLTERDYRDMVQKLSYAQIKITLPYAFDFPDQEAVGNFLQNLQRRNYVARRLDSLLTPAEREAAQSPDGIALGDISARQIILREVTFRNPAQIKAYETGADAPPTTVEQILQSRIFFPKANLAGLTPSGRIFQRLDGLRYDPTALILKSEPVLYWQ